jgi:hypothetical protein
MRNRKILFLIILLFFTNYCRSQYIDSASVNKLMNKNTLPYLGKNGRPIGEKPLEASPIRIVFYSFYLNKVLSKAIIKGRIIDPSAINDSVGLSSYIFLATPIGNKLTRLRIFEPSYSRKLNDPHEDKFPYRNGDFKIEFKFNRNERLYFNGELSDFIEYNIGMLLTQK